MSQQAWTHFNMKRGRPSIGTCLQHCPHYEGVDRTPEMVSRIVSLTIGSTVRVPVPALKSPPKPPTPADAVRYLAAEVSLFAEGPVPLHVFEQRMEKCIACPHRVIDDGDGRAFCNKCGCGARDRAKLDVRLHMPRTQCPLDPPRWTEANGEGILSLRRIGGVWRHARAALRSTGMGLRDLVAAYRQREVSK